MIYIKNNSNNPYFNTASEEYILENFDDGRNAFMLWRNEPCVYLGKNQNAYAEINLEYAAKNNIKVVRRLSGGGCVYHDMGNINFSYFSPVSDEGDDGKILNFGHFTKPVIHALQNLGVKAELIGRNDLLIEGMKFSGNAQYVHKNKAGIKKILHHGTILFDADMSKLSEVLNADEEKIKSKSVKSVRSRVTNVINHLPGDKKMTADEFYKYLEDYVISENGCDVYDFTEEDIKSINFLADNYYNTNKFIYGANLKYSFKKKKYFEFGTVEVCFNAQDSMIGDAKIYGDFFGEADIQLLEEHFNGLPHDRAAIKEKLENADMEIGKFIKGCDAEKLLSLFV